MASDCPRVGSVGTRFVDRFRDFANSFLDKDRYIYFMEKIGMVPEGSARHLGTAPADLDKDSLTATFWIESEFKRLGYDADTFQRARDSFFKSKRKKRRDDD